MKEITNRSALIVHPKDPFKEWAKKYNEEPNEDLDRRLKEKHAYLIDWSYDENIFDVSALSLMQLLHHKYL